MAWIYRAFLYNRYNPKLGYTVTSAKHFDNDVTEIRLSPDDQLLTYTSGQFTFLSIEDQNHGEAHPYTISSHPSEPGLRFSIKALGDYTAQLQSSLQAGTKATVQGTFGAFNFTRCVQTKQLWLAGGIGITPFLAFLKAVSPQYEITLVWSVNSIADAIYGKEIEHFTAAGGNIRFVLWNTSEKGYFTIDNLMTSADLKNCAAFICGPEAMRETYIDQLLEKGVDIADIHYEGFSFR